MADLEELTAQKLFDITGWVCVVTGGGTGLGLMTARALAANGARVYVTGRRVEKLRDAEMSATSTSTSNGGCIIAVQMDCTDKESIRAGVGFIRAKGEKFVNLLVNNAGVTSCNWGEKGMPMGGDDVEAVSEAMFDNQDFQDWTAVYAVNVASYYFTSVAFLPLLVAARENGHAEAGSILNVSSISGITKESQNGQFSYNASKAATISLTEQLAVELKRPGLEVRVNTVAPGYFPSEMTPIGVHSGKEKEYFRNIWGVPLGRAGVPRDYAQALLNFATNGYITGSTLVIDGGWLLAHA